MFETNIADHLKNLLEDFDIVGTPFSIALLPMQQSSLGVRDNILAAIIASSHRLKSIDYVKERYVRSSPIDASTSPLREYINAYKSAKQYIEKLILRLSGEGLPLPSNGAFGASLVLERLPISFFSAHLLYRLGQRYEAHAVSRLILEQIAWAHEAYKLEDVDAIEKIVTTKTISNLKKVIPAAGNLYGFLSNKTHINYKSHIDFLRVENGQNMVLHSHQEFYEYAEVMLHLADLFGIVWELSQYKYLSQVETINLEDSIYSVKSDRPFIAVIEDHLKKIETAINNSTVPQDEQL